MSPSFYKVIFRCGKRSGDSVVTQEVCILKDAVAHLDTSELYDHIRACLYTWAYQKIGIKPDYKVFHSLYQADELAFSFVGDDGKEYDALPPAQVSRGNRESL